ncbi:MAG: hydantoinase B/oxoprolinase family protein, partial [Solirubrobacterales bacterium]|nr:hydantoinase B/oxoprolinase family protein [Solirubrobacterales bacterium]
EGTNNGIEYVHADGTSSRHGRVKKDVRAGDVVRIVTGGGGGHGDPHEREPERVAADVLDGYVTPREAEDVYGVVVDPATGAVDERATADRRAA